MAKSLAQEFQELKKFVEDKKTTYHQKKGELSGVEKQMKDDHGTTPDKANSVLAGLEKQEKQLLDGIEKGLSTFREKYGMEE